MYNRQLNSCFEYLARTNPEEAMQEADINRATKAMDKQLS
jgi:hypothetical protein